MSKGNSPERARMMRALGAEVVLVEQQPGSIPGQVSGADLELVEEVREPVSSARVANECSVRVRRPAAYECGVRVRRPSTASECSVRVRRPAAYECGVRVRRPSAASECSVRVQRSGGHTDDFLLLESFFLSLSHSSLSVFSFNPPLEGWRQHLYQ